MSYTILTGDRATGSLHLGHYVGSLRQRIELQQQHQQTVLVADLQGLTDNGNNPQKISANVLNLVADYLAVGIDPQKTTICLQSALPALAELTMYYLNLVSVARLERNPTVKSEIIEKDFSRSLPAGFWFTRSARRRTSPHLARPTCRLVTISYQCWSRPTRSCGVLIASLADRY